MAVVRLRWSTLFKLTELEFVPEPPPVIKVSDELMQTISWLTGATGHDRKLLRCTDQGALLIADGWSNLQSVEADELYPRPNVPDTYTAGVENKGVLVATSTQIIMIDFYQHNTAYYDRVFIPPGWLYWYPHGVFKVIVATVPYSTGSASYVGVTAFN